MRCRRCGRDFTTPIPDIVNPQGNLEIACVEWCAECNALAMSIIFRESSAYRTEGLFDPLRSMDPYESRRLSPP